MMSADAHGQPVYRQNQTKNAVILRRVLWEHAEAAGGVSRGPCEIGPGLRARPIVLPARFQGTLDRIERAYIGAAMECARQNRTEAARLLGLGRQALEEKLRAHAARDEGGTH